MSKPFVLVTVSGGIADWLIQPEEADVQVAILDWDDVDEYDSYDLKGMIANVKRDWPAGEVRRWALERLAARLSEVRGIEERTAVSDATRQSEKLEAARTLLREAGELA